MIRFYAPDIAETLRLPESDSGHCVRVLRMRQGDEIEVTDGRGHIYRCAIVDPHPKHALVDIRECLEAPLPWTYMLTVAVAPTKHMDRMEWLVEKLTEVGVNRFVPLLTRHSERKEIKTERLEKIAVSAMKQSLKAIMPEIVPMTPLAEFIANDNSAQRFVGYCDDTVERRVLSREITAGRDVSVMIGPEGDFSPEEISVVIAAGYLPVTLGDNRLRTETAALVSATTVHIINQL